MVNTRLLRNTRKNSIKKRNTYNKKLLYAFSYTED